MLPSSIASMRKRVPPVSQKYQIRWKGGYPYGNSSINRIWDMTFTNDSNQILVECRIIASRDSSGTGSAIWTKNSTSFLVGSSSPTDGSAFIITCTATPTFTSTAISSDPGDAAFTTVFSGRTDESSYTLDSTVNFNYLGSIYTRIGVSSNSYVLFGTSSTTFSFPSYQFSGSNPSFPGIGVCAHPSSSTDTNIQFLGYRTL